MSLKVLNKIGVEQNSGSETSSDAIQELWSMSPPALSRTQQSRVSPMQQLSLELPDPAPKKPPVEQETIDLGANQESGPIARESDAGTPLQIALSPGADTAPTKSPPTPRPPKLGCTAKAPPIALPAERPANLDQMLERIDGLESLSVDKRQHIKSAVRAVGRVLGRPLRDVTTDPVQLRELLASATPASAGMTSERWMRVRSLLLGALREFGFDVMPGRDTGGLNAAWATLFARVTDKRCKTGLTRFVHFCSREGVDPNAVDKTTLPKFRDALVRNSLLTNSTAIYNMTCRLWNQAGQSVPGWPLITADPEPDARKYALQREGFPPPFLQDVERFLAHTGDRNPFADDYAPSVKPTTLELRRRGIMQLASALIASGTPATQVTGLAALVAPENAEPALRHLLGRKGGKSTPYLGQQARLLVTIAKYWVRANDDVIKKLQGFTRGLSVRKPGMTDRNRARLRQFDLPANVDELLNLPRSVLADVAKKHDGKRQSALRVMFALAAEILIVAPMRVDNLCGLNIDRHIVEIGRGRHRTRHIIIDGSETKTGIPFEKQLSPQTWRVFETYLSTYRAGIYGGPSPWLFPGRDGNRRATSRFSVGLSKFIEHESSLHMHAHLFRHLAGKLRLQDDPSDLETIKQLLGHRTSATTQRNYTETRTDLALARYEETISRLRDKVTPQILATRTRRKIGVLK
jgi:integrase